MRSEYRTCSTYPSPCINGGTCTDGLYTYTCSCPYGYSGYNCEKPGKFEKLLLIFLYRTLFFKQ